jgi:SAM-dependent methyltransferase
MELHPLARDGFADVADHYERGRPDYPAEAVRLLGLPRGARVLDLAAGTGKLTRVLRAEGLDVIPVEPLASMRARVDGALEGTAEAIPLDGASVDAITVGDAWHWFDHVRAADEMARVVRPGGVVGLFWQRPRAGDVPEWSHALGSVLGPLRVEHPGFTQDRRPSLGEHPAFTGLEEHHLPFEYRADRERYLAFIASISYVASLPAAQRADVLRRVAEVLPDGELVVGYETEVWITRRRG